MTTMSPSKMLVRARTGKNRSRVGTARHHAVKVVRDGVAARERASVGAN
jgi:hypothetical protein